MSSLMKRSVPRACSSITKAKMTSWVPSRGMSVSVDLASLGVGAKMSSFWIFPVDFSPLSMSSTPTKAWHPGHRYPPIPKTLGQAAWKGGVEVEAPQKSRGSPGAGVRARLGVPGQARRERLCRFPSSTPHGLCLLQEELRRPSQAGSVVSPALDVCLAHEIGFQFGYHNADDPDKDEEVHLQGRQLCGWRPSQGAHLPPGLPTAPPRPIITPTPTPHRHSPRWQREWAAG